jgi:CelD/BcsL family acetyltransferase involved in cellulose biosynthesis
MTFDAPTTFSHPDWLRAIMAQVPGALVLREPETGFAKLSTALQKRHLPIAYFESWLTPLCPTGLPAMAELPAESHIAALLDKLDAPILFRNLPVNHPTTQAILAAACHAHVLKAWERAGLSLKGSYDDWLASNFDHKRRKELKRLRARLGEIGELTVEALSSNGDLNSFTQNFLSLESAGWKGDRGTAIGNDPAMAAALRGGLAAMHRNGALRFWQFLLNGKPVASLFALIDGNEAALGKIAHDETHAKYSPGVLIIMAATESLLTEEGLDLADSNAIPGHPMIDRIWRDRIPCIDVLVAGQNVPAPLFKLLSKFLGTKNAMRSLAKQIFLRVTGRKRS